MRYLYMAAFSFIIARIAMPLLIKLAFKIDFLDKPTKRKDHAKPVPLLGGVGMYVAFIVGYVFYIGTSTNENISVIIASFLILTIGLVDDWHKSKSKDFSVGIRLVVQIMAALIIYNAGIQFSGMGNPFDKGNYILFNEPMQLFLTVMWILGVTTVINWLDGVDGLAASITLISSGTFLAVALIKMDPTAATLSALLLGATLGFFIFNKYPAKTYMGDSGANFLGFMLALIALKGAFKGTTVVSIFVPILALGIPIFDNLYVIFRRAKKGKAIYAADASQIHHRLIKTGYTPQQTVLVISLISSILSLISIILLLLEILRKAIDSGIVPFMNI